MKRRTLTLLVMSALCLVAAADNYSSYYKDLPVDMTKVSDLPKLKKSVDVSTLGAVGDGKTLCTEALQKAIDQMSEAGGGRVVVPFGVWLTGPLEMKDNVDLHIEKNAILYFSPDKTLYIGNDTTVKRVNPCISANKRKNVSITGEGIIDGNGNQWRPVKREKVSDVEWKRFNSMGGVQADGGKLWYPYNLKKRKNIRSDYKVQEGMRNDLIRFVNCENVKFEGVTFQNSPRFHVHPLNCRNVIIDGITVRCPWNAQNGDAIDISDCHVVLIVNSTVDAGDDGLCMKSNTAKKNNLVSGCEDILIENNTVYNAHGGFVIGSEDICGITRLVVRNCRFSGTEVGLRFKSGVGRGGKTKDLYISNIVMSDIQKEAVIFQCDYVNRHAGRENDVQTPEALENVPEFTDIHISNVVCRGSKTGISASGIEGLQCVHGITISNSTFVYTSKDKNIDETTAELQLDNVVFVSETK